MAQDDASDSGLTRFAYELMHQQIPLYALADMTTIPSALLSQYTTGRRTISRHHLAILSIALDVPAYALASPVPTALVYIDENEWGPDNPMPKFRYRRTKEARLD